jgi:hypothetical protein
MIRFKASVASGTVPATPSQQKTMYSLLEQKQAGFMSEELFERLRERCGMSEC